MPVEWKKRIKPSESRDLVDRLVAEWRVEKNPEPKPYVIIEGDEKNGPLHIYVVWDEWEGLSMEERSRTIMDAFEKVESQENQFRVTIAMGLTPEEAPRMGIELSQHFS
jgi:hypothetical protein